MASLVKSMFGVSVFTRKCRNISSLVGERLAEKHSQISLSCVGEETELNKELILLTPGC